MGLFDDVVGAFLKGDAGKYQAILSWVEEQGGIQVLLEKLQSGGLGAILSTWLSNQQSNQSVSGEQVESALGTNAVSDLGQKLGVDTSTASSLLAEQLPKIIDALSPQGEVSPQAHNDLLSAGMELLKGKLFPLSKRGARNARCIPFSSGVVLIFERNRVSMGQEPIYLGNSWLSNSLLSIWMAPFCCPITPFHLPLKMRLPQLAPVA